MTMLCYNRNVNDNNNVNSSQETCPKNRFISFKPSRIVDEIKVAEIDLFFELKLNFVIITSNDSAPRSSHLAFVHNTANICV